MRGLLIRPAHFGAGRGGRHSNPPDGERAVRFPAGGGSAQATRVAARVEQVKTNEGVHMNAPERVGLPPQEISTEVLIEKYAKNG